MSGAGAAAGELSKVNIKFELRDKNALNENVQSKLKTQHKSKCESTATASTVTTTAAGTLKMSSGTN